MIEYRENNEVVAVDRQIDTLVTQHPGYIETVQVVRDIDAESQLDLFLFHRIVWTLLSFLEILLAFRFVLRLIAANPNSGFGMLMYGVTGLFVAPFNGLVPTPAAGGSLIEITTLIAMVVYILIFWGIEYVIRMVADLTFIRAFTHSTRLPTPGREGNLHSTRTTSTNGRLYEQSWRQ